MAILSAEVILGTRNPRSEDLNSKIAEASGVIVTSLIPTPCPKETRETNIMANISNKSLVRLIQSNCPDFFMGDATDFIDFVSIIDNDIISKILLYRL